MRRVLLDEGFPDPPGFDPTTLQDDLSITSLRTFAKQLISSRTPDWYLYLRADEAGYDALVTSDWRQSEQPEELWTLSRTRLSVVTWRKPTDDPVVKWAQLIAYLPALRRLADTHGPSIFFLPNAALNRSQHMEKSLENLHQLAKSEGRSGQEARDEAPAAVVDYLEARGEVDRFAQYVHPVLTPSPR